MVPTPLLRLSCPIVRCSAIETLSQHAIQPRLIPRRHIDEAADQIIGEFADPEWEAFLRHDQAWHDSDGAAQTHWLRVRKAIRRKLDQLGDDAGR